MQDRHLDFFLRLAEDTAQYLRDATQARQFERLEAEHDNLRAALDWSLSREPKHAAGLRLAAALPFFRATRGYFQEAREYLMAALAQNPGDHTAARAQALYGVGDAAFVQGDYATAREFLDASLSLYREFGTTSRRALAHTLALRGYVETEVGDYATASQLIEQSLAIMRELNDEPGIARALRELGTCALRS